MSEDLTKTPKDAKVIPEILSLFAPFEAFCKVMLDAYIVVDESGKIVKCNQMFSVLTGQSTKQIIKSGDLTSLISFELNKMPWTIADILSSKTPTRVDEVRGKNHQTSDLNLIIGIYPFVAPDTSASKGAFVLFRDVTAETALQDKYKDSTMKSITDPLTGLFTRGYFEEYLNMQVKNLAGSPRDSESMRMSLAILDIDFFKKVNDKFGHQAGDHVLRIVSGILKKTFRKTDIACRYGGEEFLVILPGTDLYGSLIACEKLRASVEAEHIVFNDQHIPVTISSGIAEILIGKEKYEETIARADTALYESKHAGRNRVTLHDGVGLKATQNALPKAS